jgi:cAMP-binding proteins - catabolite gene activator and regulatory subunit of cAMP-dependent protein kinases
MKPRVSLAGRLGTTWFGGGLPPRARERLASIAEVRAFSPGEVLLKEGTECHHFGVLLSGLLAMQVVVPGQGSVTLLTIEPGDVYGWSAVVAPHRTTSTVVGVEGGEVLAFSAESLRDLLNADDVLAATLYPRLLQAMSRRLTATRLQLLDLYAHEREVLPW